jgi:hypothetical protein
MLRKFLLGCGVVSSVLYVVVDILGARRYPGYHYADQEFSELTAEGAPTRPFMLALSGVPYTGLVTAFAAGVGMSPGPKRVARVTGFLLLGYAVAGLVTVVFFPMRPREDLAAGQVTWRNTLHPHGTVVQSLFLVLAMAFGATLGGKGVRYYSYGTILTLLVFGGLASVQVNRMAANQSTPWMGIEERVNIYASMLWVAVLARALLRTQDTSAPG